MIYSITDIRRELNRHRHQHKDEIRNKLQEATQLLIETEKEFKKKVVAENLKLYRIENYTQDLVIAKNEEQALELYIEVIGESTPYEDEIDKEEFIKDCINPLNYSDVLPFHEWGPKGETVRMSVAEVIYNNPESQYLAGSEY